jgi:uncharacterized protein YqgC (DUF456 family)
MGITLIILAFVLLIIGIVGAVVPALPGPPLSFIGLLLVQWSGYGSFTPAFLWVWAGITVFITVMDYILPALLARRFGGSRFAAIGSFVGLVIGIFFFAPWGMIVGTFLGALAGELIHNRENKTQAFKAACGALLAFIAGAGAKLIASSIMLFYAVKVAVKASVL